MIFKINEWVVSKEKAKNEDLNKPQKIIRTMKSVMIEKGGLKYDMQLKIELDDELLNYLSLQHSEDFRLATDLEMKIKQINKLFINK